MIETTDNPMATSEDAHSNTVAPAGYVSFWCVADGAAAEGYKSADQLIQNGLPFGHGSNKIIRGFKKATIASDDPSKKPRLNTMKGPLGINLVEVMIPEADMKAKQEWESQVSEERVAAAKAASTENGDIDTDPETAGQGLLRKRSLGVVDVLSDDARAALEEKHAREQLAQHP